MSWTPEHAEDNRISRRPESDAVRTCPRCEGRGRCLRVTEGYRVEMGWCPHCGGAGTVREGSGHA